jgi:hypothetical protein
LAWFLDTLEIERTKGKIERTKGKIKQLHKTGEIRDEERKKKRTNTTEIKGEK